MMYFSDSGEQPVNTQSPIALWPLRIGELQFLLMQKKGGRLMPGNVRFNCLVSGLRHTKNFYSRTA